MYSQSVIRDTHGDMGSDSVIINLGNGLALDVSICDDTSRCDICREAGADTTHVALYDPRGGDLAVAEMDNVTGKQVVFLA